MSHNRCQWMMVNDVDNAVNTHSNLPETGLWDPKLETANPMTTRQSPYHYWSTKTNKWQDIRQYLFHLKQSRKPHKSFLFLLRGKTTGFGDTNSGDNCSNYRDGTRRSALALKDGFSECFHCLCLASRKDIKAFSQSWQKNTGKWADPATLTKSGAGSARMLCFYTELQCCDGWSAGKVQGTVAQLWLLKVDVFVT